MLYISRALHMPGMGRIDSNRVAMYMRRDPASDICYVVVDSDDGSGDIVTLYDIAHLCLDLGIGIEGVLAKNGYIGGVVRVQCKSTATAYQMKLASLYGIQIPQCNGCISSIRFNSAIIKSPPRVRLSDIANKCGDYLFLELSSFRRHALTLILDDRLDFTPYSFLGYKGNSPGLSGHGVVFDLSELTDICKVRAVYELLYSLEIPMSYTNSIIDSPDRMTSIMRSLREQ